MIKCHGCDDDSSIVPMFLLALLMTTFFLANTILSLLAARKRKRKRRQVQDEDRQEALSEQMHIINGQWNGPNVGKTLISFDFLDYLNFIDNLDLLHKS